MTDCICGEINARHCPFHNEKNPPRENPDEYFYPNSAVWKMLDERDSALTKAEAEIEKLRADLKAAADVIEEFFALLDEQILVRNTDSDGDFDKFLKQGCRLAGHWAECFQVLARIKKKREGNEF